MAKAAISFLGLVLFLVIVAGFARAAEIAGIGQPTAPELVLGALFAVSEALALMPSVQSNSVFQLFYGLLKKIVGRRAH